MLRTLCANVCAAKLSQNDFMNFVAVPETSKFSHPLLHVRFLNSRNLYTQISICAAKLMRKKRKEKDLRKAAYCKSCNLQRMFTKIIIAHAPTRNQAWSGLMDPTSSLKILKLQRDKISIVFKTHIKAWCRGVLFVLTQHHFKF